ncbi:MAG: RyR domain-containing protein [Methylovulum sp.]|nr:RyR domain-containing protein [Methylovulum sp.]
MSAYQPKPIDTSKVTLSPEVLALTEQLAENAHDLWAAQRLADGWRLGDVRDDANKLHPCLIAYAQLPESEKEYDRQAAMETLKAIVALGYEIGFAQKPAA